MKKTSSTTKANVEQKALSLTDSEKIYFIKSPSEKRKSWAIVSFVYTDDRKRIYIPFDDERVKSINKRFKDGSLDTEACKTMLEEIIDGLYKRNKNLKMVFRKQILNAENEKLLNDFWENVYSSKILADESSAKYDFLRAFKRLKNVSLYTASAQEITTQLKKECSNANQHRRSADRLNEVLRYLKRDIRLAKPEEDLEIVRYLNETQVHKLAALAPSVEIKCLTYTLFGSGARVGEALGITPNDLSDGAVFIQRQLKRDGSIKKPKRKKTGKVPLIPSMEKYVKQWVSVKDKGSYRYEIYTFIAEHGPKFGIVSPHDLRHSYAIHCLSKGMSLGMVANSLRNRIEVCQKYYTGFEHNTDTLEAAKKILA